jgi:hypothetical protein
VLCVSRSTVPRVCWEAKNGKEKGTEKVFLSPRKHKYAPKRVPNLDNFQQGVLWIIVVEYYDKRQILYSQESNTCS